MDDHKRLALEPRPEFVEELERTLLSALDKSNATRPTIEERETFMLLDLNDPSRARLRRPRRRLVGALAPVAAAAAAIVALVVVNRGGPSTLAVGPSGSAGISAAFQLADNARGGLAWVTDIGGLDGSMPTSSSSPLFRDFHGAGSASGSVAGSYKAVWVANVAGTKIDGAEFVRTYIFRGTVEGCGTGDFMIYDVVTYREADGNPNADSNGLWSGHWNVVPESGRDGLEGIGGSGTSTSRLEDPSQNFTGTFTCGH